MRPADTGRRAAPPPPPPAGRRAAPPVEPTGRRAAPDPNGHRAAPPADPNGHRVEPTGRRAAPEPPPAEPTGRRAAPEPPRAEPTGRRAAPEPPQVEPDPFFGESTGRRAAPEPPPVEPTGRRAAESTGRRAEPTGRRVAPEPPLAEPTGRRAAPEPPRAESTGRRAAPDPFFGEPTGRRAAPEPPPADPDPFFGESTGRRAAPEPPPAEPTGRRAAESTGRRAESTGRRVAPEQLSGQRPIPPVNRPPLPPEAGHRAAPPQPPVEPTGRRAAPPVPPVGHPGEATGTRPRPVVPPPVPPADGTGRRPRPIAPPPPGAAPQPPRGDLTGPRPIPGRDATGPRAVPPRPDATGPRPIPPGAGPLPPNPGSSGSLRIPVDSSGPRRAPVDSRLNPPAGDAPEPPRPSGPERREEIDPASLTTEMEAIGDDVKKRREVDHTLARFSAVHDELAEQERKRKERKQKLMPWKAEEDEDKTEYAEPVVLDEDGEVLPPRGRTPKHSKIVRILKIISLTSAVLVFVSVGLGWGALQWVDSKFTEIDALGSNTAAVQDAEKQLGDENFLIVGSDTRANAKPQDGVGDAQNEQGARSDVLMLAHVPADRKRVVVVSLPRDVRVDRPACEGWDPATGDYNGEQIEAAKGAMANEAYAVGGPKCVTAMMSEITHLNINHFISVDFNGFKSMVDAVGSVNVCVPKPMKDDELGVLFEKAGKYDISGDQALNYVRARKVSGEVFGDYDRITRQQKFLSSLLRKALSNEILLNPGKLNSFINAFAASTQGQNVGADQLLTLGQSLQGLEAGRVSFVTMPHRTEEGPTLSPDDNTEEFVPEEANRLFQAIINGTPLPGETPDANPTGSPSTGAAPPAQPGKGKVVDAKSVKLQVLNGDPDNPGAATRLKDSLKDVGFDVVRFDDNPPVDKTIIKYGAGGEDGAATLGAAVPGATLQFDASMGSAVALVIGPNFDEKVVSPQGGTAQNTASGQTAPPADLSIVNGGADPCA